jgi:hypothetical protein
MIRCPSLPAESGILRTHPGGAAAGMGAQHLGAGEPQTMTALPTASPPPRSRPHSRSGSVPPATGHPGLYRPTGPVQATRAHRADRGPGIFSRSDGLPVHTARRTSGVYRHCRPAPIAELRAVGRHRAGAAGLDLGAPSLSPSGPDHRCGPPLSDPRILSCLASGPCTAPAPPLWRLLKSDSPAARAGH